MTEPVDTPKILKIIATAVGEIAEAVGRAPTEDGDDVEGEAQVIYQALLASGFVVIPKEGLQT